MSGLITDDMMHTIAVYGTPDQVAAEIVRRYGDCDRVCAYFPGYDASDELIGEFAAVDAGRVESDDAMTTGRRRRGRWCRTTRARASTLRPGSRP